MTGKPSIIPVTEGLPTTRRELSGRLALMNSEGLVARCTAAHDMKRAFDVLWMGMTVHAARRERTILHAFEIAKTRAFPFWEVQMGKSNSLPTLSLYSANYGNFQTDLYAQIRQEAFGEDIGQNSWLTSNEQDRFLEWLDLSPGKTLLDVACGAGGPALRIAAATGCSVVGIDVHEQAVTAASSLAAQRGLAEQAKFGATDATGPLPFSNANFDAITCIDAINHFPDRPRVIAEWARLLKMGGRLLFTDPITLTGPLTNAEMAVRSSAGFYLFVPCGYDERVIA